MKALGSAIQVNTRPTHRSVPIAVLHHEEFIRLGHRLTRLGGYLLLQFGEALYLLWNDKVFLFEGPDQ